MPKTSIFALIFVLAVCSACILLDRPPAPVSVSAPPMEFSAERAMMYLWTFAQKPHPIGSAEHDRIRDYLVAELTRLGVTPEIQRTTGITPRYQAAGSVENIVARVNGSSGAKDAVMLAAHYDSVPAGPGAGDDGAGVAAILETLRALRAGPVLHNDVILLLTDGEEDGLLGSSAFMAEHPWAKDVRVALNFEGRGNAGVSQMFETSPHNGRLIDALAQAVRHPHGSSLTYEIYKHMPNDTDMTIFKNHGVAGLNFAFIGHWEAYHTPLDNPQQLRRGSLQQHGDYALALARTLGNADLAQPRSTDAVYFEVPGGWFIHYSSAWIWQFTFVAIAAFLAISFYASGASQTGIAKIALGFAVNLILAAVLAVTASGFAKGINWLHSQRLPEGDVMRSAPYALGLVALLVLLWTAVLYLVRKKLSPASLFLGGAVALLLVEVVAARHHPGASYLILWPLLALLLAVPFAAASEEESSPVAMVALCVLALPAFVLFVPILRGFYEGVGLTSIGAPALAVLLALLLMAVGPLLDALRRILPLTALGFMLLFLIIGAAVTRYTAAHPKPSVLVYALDADTGKALWASDAARLDPWTERFVGAAPVRDKLGGFFPDWLTFRFLQHEALSLPLRPPEVQVIENSVSSGSRVLRLRISSPRHARTLTVVASENEILDASVNGHNLGKPSEARFNVGGKWSLNYANLPAEGIDLGLVVRGNGSVKLRVVDRSSGLPESPGAPFPPRPPDSMPHHSGDETLVLRTFVF